MSKANIGLLEHIQCTLYARQSENVYSKVQIPAANLQNQKFITVFTEFTNVYEFTNFEIWAKKFVNFTNFKTLGQEFSIYELYPVTSKQVYFAEL